MDTKGKETDEKIKRLEKEWGIPIGPVTRKILEFQTKKWNYGDVIAYLDQKEKESEERYRKRKEFEAWKKERLERVKTTETPSQEVQEMDSSFDEKIKRLEKEWGIPIGPVTRKILKFQKKKWNYGDVIAYLDQKEEESEQRYSKRKEFEQWKKERLKALEVRQAEK